MDFKCSYNLNRSFRRHYAAVVLAASILHKDTAVGSIKGTHIEGKTDNDVSLLLIQSCRVHYFPMKTTNTFPNLTALSIDTCGLIEIKSEDLCGLENLRFLWLRNNELKSLPSNLLQNTRKLRIFDCSGNPQLEYINPKFLSHDHLKKLVQANFRGTKCISKCFPNDCKTLEELKAEIASKCKIPIDEVLRINNTKLAGKFWDLWATKIFSDFIIEAEDKKFKVHKNVLGLQSSVFATAFQTHFQESKSNRMRIVGFSSDAVGDFLQYFYCGRISEVNAMEVFALAAQYDVIELKIIAEKLIADNIDEQNVVEVLGLGNIHGSDIIMRAAFNEIKKFLNDPKLSMYWLTKPKYLIKLMEAKRAHVKETEDAKEKYENKIQKFVPKQK